MTGPTARASAAAFLVLACLLASFSAREKSPTYDEPTHLLAGLAALRGEGFATLNPEHPPLLKLGAAAAALPWNPALPRDDPLWSEPRRAQTLLAERMLYGTPDWPAMLQAARTVPIACFLLGGLAAFLLARELYGARAGLIAAAFYACDPNLIAHGRLVTTDVPLASFSLLAAWALLRWWRRPTLPRALAAGAALGLALAVKFLAVVLLAPAGLALVLRWRRSVGRPEPRQFAGGLLACFGVLWLAYGCPLDPRFYWEGLSQLYWNHRPGAFFYLNGEFYTGRRLAYFPVAFLVKSPLPALAFLALGALSLAGWRPRRRELFGLLPLLGLSLPVVFLSQNLGVRYLLPALGFAYVLAARCAAPRAPAWAGSFVLVLALAQAGRAVTAFPDYIPFANAAVGGPGHTLEYLDDSNLDWGQDLGRSFAAVEPGFGPVLLVSLYAPSPRHLPAGVHRLDPLELAVRTARPGETYLVGAGALLRAHAYARGALDRASFLERYQPDEVVGHSMFVYRF